MLLQCRDEMDREQSEQGRSSDAAGSTSGKQVDLKDLSWTEREAILRLLFKKMNSNTSKQNSSSLSNTSFS